MKEKHVGGNDANDDSRVLSCPVRLWNIFRVWTMTNEQDVYGTAHYRY